MRGKWRELYDQMPADRRARVEAHVAKDLADMQVHKLRRALIAATRELSRTWPPQGRAAVRRQRLIRQCERALARKT